MEENNNEQTTTKVESTVKQKVLLVLALIGLIGFGFMISLVAEVSVEPTSISSKPYKQFVFQGTSLTEVEKQMLEQADEMGFTTKDIDLIIKTAEKLEAGEGTLKWGGNPFTCNSCGFSKKGYCVMGACVGGHIHPDDYYIEVAIHI